MPRKDKLKNKEYQKRYDKLKVEVTCNLQVSSLCKRTYNLTRRCARRTRQDNHGNIICVMCSRQTKFVGTNNPNCKYKTLDHSFLNNIDCTKKAYLLGWIASDGSVTPGSITIAIHPKDKESLKNLRDIVCSELPIKHKKSKNDIIYFTISSMEMSKAVCSHLNILPKKKSHIVQWPTLANDQLYWAFLRGYFEGDGYVSKPNQKNSPHASISSMSKPMLTAIQQFTKIPSSIFGINLVWSSINAIDFGYKLYEDNSCPKMERKYDKFLSWSWWQPSIKGKYGCHPTFKWTATDPGAIVPSKRRASDSGYDLYLIKKLDTQYSIGSNLVEWYDTCIKVRPDLNWCFLALLRSSMASSGYIMPHSLGLIDQGYTGTVIIPLMKIDPDAPDLILPCKAVQLMPLRHTHMTAVQDDNLCTLTFRDKGSFGSTGTR